MNGSMAKKAPILPVLLAAVLLLCGCGGGKEMEKLKAENEKLKGDVQRLEDEVQRLQAENDVIGLRKEYHRAMSDMRLIGNALESYITDRTRLPEGGSLAELAYNRDFVPFYIKDLPAQDPWGRDYFYQKSPGGEIGTYWLASAGSDGLFRGFEQSGRSELQPGMDIVFANGEFVLAPKL